MWHRCGLPGLDFEEPGLNDHERTRNGKSHMQAAKVELLESHTEKKKSKELSMQIQEVVKNHKRNSVLPTSHFHFKNSSDRKIINSSMVQSFSSDLKRFFPLIPQPLIKNVYIKERQLLASFLHHDFIFSSTSMDKISC